MAKLQAADKAAPSKTPTKDPPSPPPESKTSSGSVLATATPLSKAEDYLSVVLYGREGTGKTTAAAAMANLGRTLIVQAEAGVKAKALDQHGVKTSNILVVPQRGERLTYEELDQLFWDLKAELDADPNSWAGVVWDSLTDIHVTLKEEATATNIESELARGKQREPFHTDLRDFGVMTEMVRRLLRRFRDLPCHFCVTALERRDQDEDGTVAYGPAITPALMQDVPGFFDVVGHTSVEEVGGEDTFIGAFSPAGKYRAKDRYGLLPKRLPNPGFDRMFDYVSGKLTQEKDKQYQAVKNRLANETKEQ